MLKPKHLLYLCMTIPLASSCDSSEKSDLNNPFIASYSTPYEVPPFDQIKDDHFRPAFEAALKQHISEIEEIVAQSEAPTFANTIEKLEYSGELLYKVSTVFYNLNSANTNDSIQAIAQSMAPVLSQHNDNIKLNAELFNRVKAIWEQKESLQLNSEQTELLNKTYKSFIRSGANLSEELKQSLRDINAEISLSTVKFGQNILAETNSYELVIENEAELEGLPESLKMSGAAAAKEKGKEGKWVFTLHNPSVMPFLQYASNRELRNKIWSAYMQRGDNNDSNDNKEILTKIANLRLKKANLLGYPSHAHYVLEESMAENPDNVYKLLNSLWTPALKKAKVEAADINKEIQAEGNNFKAEPYDWRYYTEIIRKKRYSLDENEMKPYFSLKSVREGAFDVANKLYGLNFKAITNVPVYHQDVEVYEVTEKDGSLVGVLYADFFPRESKRGGAWMTSYRAQKTVNGQRIAPVISIVCNFTKPVGDTPALLTFDEVTTLFHEFGHALHGLLSNVQYQSLAGTSVPRDFVELPSQIMENWAADPEVLKLYAKHYQTGEIIPDELVTKMINAGTFDQGFATVEYLAASFLDLNYHAAQKELPADVRSFEDASMKKIGLISEIIPRYRSTYFNHVFSGGYSSGYYSYIWSAVLDTDAFAAFKEKSLFDQELASAFRTNVLEKGGTEKSSELYRKFRGSDPNPVHLMKKRGLD